MMLYRALTNMENVIGNAIEITSGMTGFSFIFDDGGNSSAVSEKNFR